MQLIQQKMDRGNKPILEMELEALPSWVPQKCQGEVGIENLPKTKKKTEKGKRKRGRSATKHKKV